MGNQQSSNVCQDRKTAIKPGADYKTIETIET